MGENALIETNNGQEVQQADVNQLGSTSGLADDHLLADLVRLAPYAGSTFSKAVVPFGAQGLGVGTVQPSGRADGSVLVFPFRAIVGSRNTVTGAPVAPPTGLTTDAAALANWRDIRSGVFIGSTNVTLYQSFDITANSSGHPRWDLVYASIMPDTGGPSVNRRVKNPTTGVISVVSVPAYLYQPVTVTVLPGTPATTPTKPALPADGSGAYNIPLAYVRVPNGFSSSTTVDTQDVRSTTTNGTMQFLSVNGAKVVPCNGNNDENTVFDTSGNAFYYTPNTAGSRPAPWLPPDWSGGRTFVGQVDNLTPGSYSHANLAVVDSSIDWRMRFTKVAINYGTGLFATDVTATTGADAIPYGASGGTSIVTLGNSMVADTTLASNSSTLWSATIGGVGVSLIVQQSTGNLLWHTAGSVGQRFSFWIDVTEQFPNY